MKNLILNCPDMSQIKHVRVINPEINDLSLLFSELHGFIT